MADAGHPPQAALRLVEPEDLLNFGLIPEFIGRLPMISVLDELTEEELVEVLTETKNALTKQYTKLFAMDNVGLTFTKDALKALAQEAARKGTGARALRAILEKIMLDLMYDLPSREDIIEVHDQSRRRRRQEVPPHPPQARQGSGLGPPPYFPMAHLWGIDLGGTKIEGVVLDPAHPDKPLCRLRVPTESEKGYAHIRSQISLLCKMISEKSGSPLPERIGMGTPGVLDPQSQKLKNSNTQCLNGQFLQKDVETDLGVKFILANDANCFALAEATLGAARGYPTTFGIIMGTGVGGGVVVNGQVLPGCHGIAGEWGQIVLDPNGPVLQLWHARNRRVDHRRPRTSNASTPNNREPNAPSRKSPHSPKPEPISTRCRPSRA